MMILDIITQFQPIDQVIPTIYQGWLPIVLAAASLASGIYATSKKAQASRDLRNANRDVANRQQSLADYYDAERNKDFFDTDMAKGAVDRLTKQYKDETKKNADKVSKSGATQESKVASQAEYLKKYNDAISNIAGYGVNYKNNMNRSYQGILGDLYKGNDITYGADVRSYGNLQNNSFNALSQSLGTLDSDVFKKNDDIDFGDTNFDYGSKDNQNLGYV